MNPETNQDWFAQVSASLRKDPKKPALMAMLAAVLVVMWGRLLFGGPKSATASIAKTSGSGNALLVGGSTRRSENPALIDWLNQQKKPVDRNLFAVDLERFPVDHNIAASHVRGSYNENADDLGKLGDVKSDANKEQASLQKQAAALRLFSTVMSSPPQALVNGVVVEQGDMLGAFRVVKIEPRRVIVEADDSQFEITMK